MNDIEKVAHHELLSAMADFVEHHARGRSPAGLMQREVVTTLATFMASIDVTPWLGPELAAHLDEQRRLRGDDAFLATLGLGSLVRVLPAFVEEPWLPPAGPERRAHRAATKLIAKFLRLQSVHHGCHRREDFQVINRKLNYSYTDTLTQPVAAHDVRPLVACTLTLDLQEHLLDALLDDVAHGHHESLETAISSRLNPVPVTMWMDPDEAASYRRNW